MKQKKFDKRLSLNKNTIANLGNNEMNELHGGISGSRCGNETCFWVCDTNRFNCPSAPWTNCTNC